MKCRVNGCTAEHRSDMLCCKRHWFKLPKAVRDRIWDLYRNGPEDEHRAACFAALASLEPITCDFRDAHDVVTDTPAGNRCGAKATHRIEWEDGRYSFGCDVHLEIDEAATVKPIAIKPLPIGGADA